VVLAFRCIGEDVGIYFDMARCCFAMNRFYLSNAKGCFAHSDELAFIVVIESRHHDVFVRTVFDLEAACEHRRERKEKGIEEQEADKKAEHCFPPWSGVEIKDIHLQGKYPSRKAAALRRRTMDILSKT
jgi:hypothetical protein